MKLGTREQKHTLGNREHQNRRNTFREHGNTRKILLETREHGVRIYIGRAGCLCCDCAICVIPEIRKTNLIDSVKLKINKIK